MCAVQLARRARVIGTVRSTAEDPAARMAGARELLLNDETLPQRVRELEPEGVDHIVEVAFGANIDRDIELLKVGASIGAYATDNATPKSRSGRWSSRTSGCFSLGAAIFRRKPR